MSDDSRSRQMVRELTIWPAFMGFFPFTNAQSQERGVIFGLYSGAYVNGQQYLQQIEIVELANLLNDYNMKVAMLTTDEQVVALDLASKLYLANVDVAIHNQQMVTMAQKVSTASDLMSARFSALAVDQAALVTMKTQVATEIVKTNAKIESLQAEIQTEAYALDEVGIQILEKQIESEKVTLQQLTTANEVLEIQVRIGEEAIKLIDIDVKLAQNRVDLANVEKEIAKIALVQIDVEVEHAKTLIDQSELPVAAERVALANAKILEASTELVFEENVLPAQEAIDFYNRQAAENIDQITRLNELSKWLAERTLQENNKVNISNLEVLLAARDQAVQVLIDKVRVNLINAEPPLVWTKVYAVLDAAKTVAAADIKTTLTHVVEKAPA